MAVPIYVISNELFFDEQVEENSVFTEDSICSCDECESDCQTNQLHFCSSCTRHLCNECFMSDFDTFCYDCHIDQE